MSLHGNTTVGRISDRRCAALTWSSMAALACVVAACICVSACDATEGASNSTVAPQPNGRQAIATGHAVSVSPSGVKGATRHRRGTGGSHGNDSSEACGHNGD